MMKKFLVLVVLAIVVAWPAYAHRPVRCQSVDNGVFKTIISKRNTVIIDVRTPLEYAGGHIPGAINLDYNSRNFENEIRRLDSRYDYAIYCRSGSRSKSAAKRMCQLGLKVYELRYGITKWSGQVTRVTNQAVPPGHRPGHPSDHNNGYKESDRRSQNGNSNYRSNERR